MLNLIRDSLKDNTKPKLFEWIYFSFAFLISLLFLSQYGDMDITIKHSLDLISITKNGDFFNFYSIVLEKALTGGYYGNPLVFFAANYNILIYFLLSLWLLPLKIIGFLFKFNFPNMFLIIYTKVLIGLFICASAYLLKKLLLLISKFNDNDNKWIVFIYISSPALLFGSAAFGQFDIFGVTFTLLALIFYFKNKLTYFSLIMSFAICFKVFAFFIFIPLILLAEKRILHIVKHMLYGFILLAFTRIIFFWDSGYAKTQKMLDDLYKFKGRLFEVQFPGIFTGFSVFVFLFIAICIFSYYIKFKDKEKSINYSLLIVIVSYTNFLLFVRWHPQWFIIITPFIALAMSRISDIKTFLLIDIGISGSYILTSCIFYIKNVDNYMINGGLIPAIFNKMYNGITIKDIIEKFNVPISIPVSLFASLLIVFSILLYIELFKKNNTEVKIEKGLIWLRTSIIPGFFFICLFLYLYYFN